MVMKTQCSVDKQRPHISAKAQVTLGICNSIFIFYYSGSYLLDSVLQKLLSDIDISKKIIRVQNWSYNTIWNATKLNKRSQYFLICRAFAPLETCDHHNHPKNWDVPFCIISRKLQTLAFKEEQKAFSFQSRENAKLAEKVLWLQIK